jgi:hypothetical protein
MIWAARHFIVAAVARWMNGRQQEVIEYLKQEDRVPREGLGHRRIILNDAQKRGLAWVAKKLGR